MKANLGKHTKSDAWYAVVGNEGTKRYVVINESYAVASAVVDAINYPERWQPTEAYEIAAAIEGPPWPPAN